MTYRSRLFRWALLSLSLAVAMLSGIGVSSVSADGGTTVTPTPSVPPTTSVAWLTIEVATCPLGFTGDTSADYHAECSDNPAEAVPLTLTPGTTGTGTSALTTDTLGRIDVRLENPGTTYNVAVPSITGIQGFLVFCSGLDGTGTALSYSYTASGFRLNGVRAGDAILCDVFLIPVGTPPVSNVENTDVGAAPVVSDTATSTTGTTTTGTTTSSGLVVTQLPNTGSGQTPVTESLTPILLWMIAAEVAFFVMLTWALHPRQSRFAARNALRD